MKYAPRIALAACLLLSCCATQPTVCQILKEAVLPVSFTSDGLPVVDVQINGITEHMLVDTGAIVTTLWPSSAEALKIKDLTPSPLPLEGIGGEEKGLPSTYLKVDMGGWHILNTLIVINAPNAELPASSNIDGAIGYNMLAPFDIDLDLPEKQISLYLPQVCVPDSSPPPWPQPYGTSYTSYSLNNDDEYDVFIKLNGKTLPALIDSGSVFSSVPSSLLKPLKISPENISSQFSYKAAGYGPSLVPVSIEQFDYMTIGAERFVKPWLAVTHAKDNTKSAVIGDDYLRQHRVFIANSTDVVYFGLMR